MTDTTAAAPQTGSPTKTAKRVTWGEMLVCGLILGLTLYFILFAFLLADALFLDRNLVIKRIEKASPALRRFIGVIYYPEIVLLKFFRVVPG